MIASVRSWLPPIPLRAARREAPSEAPVPQDSCTLQTSPEPPRGVPWTSLATAAALVLGMGLYGTGVYLEATRPITPDPSQITLQQEVEQSRSCQEKKTGRLSRDGGEVERIQRLGGELAGSNRPGIAYTWTVVDDHLVNAYSCGAGSVVVDQRLSKGLEDPELLFVLAHEKGHNELRHQAETQSYLQQGWIRLHVPILNIDPRAGYEQFSRRHELDADCYALGEIQARGYTVEVAISALRKSHQAAGGGHDATHPGTRAREANLLSCRA
ncbi:MAG: M48 family metallopeptidase [Candidatus Eremiobacterota bacterium]